MEHIHFVIYRLKSIIGISKEKNEKMKEKLIKEIIKSESNLEKKKYER
jgi:hypothetical protein